MISAFRKQGQELIKLEKPEEGSWINIYPPFTREDLEGVSEQYGIPLDFLTDSIDIDERSRYERDDNAQLIVINTPALNDGITDNEALYITIPIGIIIQEGLIITLSAYKNPVIDSFLEDRVKNFDPANQAGFILQVLERNVHYFLQSLKELNNLRYEYEKELYNSAQNEELINLLNLQKSMVYIVTNLQSNELLVMKMKRSNFLRINDKEDMMDLQEDIIVDTSQALEMAEVYTNILNGTMDAFASIISNNLNNVVTRLTSVTIVLAVPTLVASIYGMNVSLPMQDSKTAFAVIIFFSVTLSLMIAWFFLRKRWV